MIFSRVKDKAEGSLLDSMDIDIAINAKGDMLVIHNKNFKKKISYINYIKKSGQLLFYDFSGKSTDLGMDVPRHTREKIQKVKRASLILMNKEYKAQDHCSVPVVIT
jgi:hypothetical protein